MTCFDFMTKCLTSWRVLTSWQTVWRRGVFFYFRTNFLTWHIFDFITHFFLHHDVFLALWQILCIMTYFWFHDKRLASWQTLWRHGLFFMSWQTWWRHDELCEVITCFCMINFLILWCFVMLCRTFWSNDTLFLMSWQTWWRHDELCVIHFFILWCFFMLCRTFWSNDKLFEVMMKRLIS